MSPSILIRILICLFALFLSSCLESERKPILNSSDLIVIEELQGLFRLGASKNNKVAYLLIEARPDRQYVASKWEVSHEGEKSELENYKVALVPLDFPQDKRYLAILTKMDQQDNGETTYYAEIRKNNQGFEYSVIEAVPTILKNRRVANALSTRSLTILDLIFFKRLAGPLSTTVLKKLFSDPDFRDGLKLSYAPLISPSPDDWKDIIIPEGTAATLTDFTIEEYSQLLDAKKNVVLDHSIKRELSIKKKTATSKELNCLERNVYWFTSNKLEIPDALLLISQQIQLSKENYSKKKITELIHLSLDHFLIRNCQYIPKKTYFHDSVRRAMLRPDPYVEGAIQTLAILFELKERRDLSKCYMGYFKKDKSNPKFIDETFQKEKLNHFFLSEAINYFPNECLPGPLDKDRKKQQLDESEALALFEATMDTIANFFGQNEIEQCAIAMYYGKENKRKDFLKRFNANLSVPPIWHSFSLYKENCSNGRSFDLEKVTPSIWEANLGYISALRHYLVVLTHSEWRNNQLQKRLKDKEKKLESELEEMEEKAFQLNRD